MEDSASRAIMLGVFVFIFVSAVTLTVFILSTITEYSEEAFEYGKVKTKYGIAETALEVENTINGAELLNYYYNYIKFDKYRENETDPLPDGFEVKYKFTYRNNDLELDDIVINREYIFKYKAIDSNGIVTIDVIES